MTLKKEPLGMTESVCPVCLKKVMAYKNSYGDKVYLEKNCPEHGCFKTLIWNGLPNYEEWANEKIPSRPVNAAVSVSQGCPYDCGLCTAHRQHTCCVLMEVTKHCSLACPVCFASAGSTSKDDPSLLTIGHWFDAMMESGDPFNIQLSGGEPTQRDDLDEIIRIGKAKGFPFFQLNTNGIRIGQEAGYVEKLAAAGLNCVFLQFDGISDQVYRTLRGKPLLSEKLDAILACKKAGVGVVLVPTIAPGVNTSEIGKILNFALLQLPTVRGVHFQPISYFGRGQDAQQEERFTLPDLLRAIAEQTGGRMRVADFTPGSAENAYCSFSGNFVLLPDSSIRPWNSVSGCGCGSSVPQAAAAAKKAREFVARRWSAASIPAPIEASDCSSCNTSSLDDFLQRVETHTLAVSAMVFMDAWNLDLERLKDCYIHVVSQRSKLRLIPFCAYNLTSAAQTTLYRGHDNEEDSK